MATPAARLPNALDDSELAKRAVAGDGDAFAELYDRHERRVYGFCMRLLGAPYDAADATQDAFVRMLARLPAMEGRELNFVAYALACARNACYDMIEGRKRVEPTAEQPDGTSLAAAAGRASAQGEVALDPERAALLAAAREDVRAANAALPARQREVLALREVELLSYDEIGEIIGLNRNAVAQLVSRARIKLRDLLQNSALSSVVASSPECMRAQPLLASLQDGQPGEGEELAWARTHLDACETCRLSRAAMEEAGVSYRALAPLVPAAWLRHAAIARAADFLGADWSHVVGAVAKTSEAGSAASGSAAGAGGSRGAEEPIGDAGRLVLRVPTSSRPRRLAMLALGVVLLALGIVVVAMAGGTRDGPVRSLPLRPVSNGTPAGLAAIQPAATVAGTRKFRSLAPATGRGAPASSTPEVVHASTPSPTLALRGSTRHPGARHRRRREPSRRAPTTSSTPGTPPTTTPPPAPSPTATAPTPTTTTPTTPTTTVPPAQTTPEPAPPTTTPGGSTGTTTTPAGPTESPRGGLIP